MVKLVRIVKRLTPEQKEKWSSFCISQGLSESVMLGMMIELVTFGIVKTNSVGFNNTKSAQLNIRVNQSVLDEITKRAKLEGFSSRTAWATSVLSQALTSKPAINENELTVIRASNRELSAIARNLNQIVRQLNIESCDSEILNIKVIQKLAKVIERHKSLLISFLDKSQKRWE